MTQKVYPDGIFVFVVLNLDLFSDSSLNSFYESLFMNDVHHFNLQLFLSSFRCYSSMFVFSVLFPGIDFINKIAIVRKDLVNSRN